jgi:hypothetical protein
MGSNVGATVGVKVGIGVDVGRTVAVKVSVGMKVGVFVGSSIFETKATCARGVQALLHKITMKKRIMMGFISIPLGDEVSYCFNGNTYHVVPENGQAASNADG